LKSPVSDEEIKGNERKRKAQIQGKERRDKKNQGKTRVF
jgi:hypothetical protein